MSLVLLSSNNPLLISRESLTHATDQYDLEEEDEEDRWLSQVAIRRSIDPPNQRVLNDL
jgi:hypothetical protein